MALLIRFLSRFRWPLLAGLVTSCVLFSLLQPRPIKVHRIPIGEGLADEFIISPSGTYMVHFGEFRDGKATFKVLNLATSDVILQENCQSKRLCRFDKDDGLAFVLNNTVYYLVAGTDKPRATATCSVTTPSIHFDISFLSLYDNGPFSYEDNNLSSNFLLSHDACTWLMPRIVDNQWQFCLLDVPTGMIRAMLEKQFPADIGPTTQFAFSPDSRLLLIQTVIHSDAPPQPVQAVVELFDIGSGKKIKTMTLPEGIKIENLVSFDEQQVTSLQVQDELPVLQIISDQEGYRRILLKEMISEPLERQWPKPGDGIWQTHAKLNERIHANNGNLLYCWELHLLPKSGGLGGAKPNLPGMYYAVRDLKSGGLLHTDRLPLRYRTNLDWKPEGWRLVQYLPDASMLMLQPSQEISAWQQQLEAWRHRYASWIPELFSRQARLHCIETITGNTSAILSMPTAFQLYSFYMPSRQSLYITYEMDGIVHLQQYAFPFQKPWLLIVYWSMGVSTAMATMQLVVQHSKRRRIPPLAA